MRSALEKWSVRRQSLFCAREATCVDVGEADNKMAIERFPLSIHFLTNRGSSRVHVKSVLESQ